MGIQGYLAMTAAEFFHKEQVDHPAWMSCHFSPWSDDLTNFPQALPPGSMLIIDDSTSPSHHDPIQIIKQLEAYCSRVKPECILLDFQRPQNAKTQEIAASLVSALAVPVGVSEAYGQGLSCPVLLNCPAPGTSLESAAADFPNRELWLELVPESRKVILTESGCQIIPETFDLLKEPFHYDTETASNYHWYLESQQAVFHIQRDHACLKNLIKQADALGFTRTIGLYQQLGSAFYTQNTHVSI